MDKLKISYDVSMFEHMGLLSSLKGKVQKFKVIIKLVIEKFSFHSHHGSFSRTVSEPDGL